jgi:SAM-dependent methyltransferase
MMTEQRPAGTEGAAPLTLAQTRANLAAEWVDRSPATPDDIADFYVSSEALAPDLDAWHDTPERQSWTDMLVHVARESGANRVVDIGCGGGHDLAALREASPGLELYGVEPNDGLRTSPPTGRAGHHRTATPRWACHSRRPRSSRPTSWSASTCWST